MQLKESQMFHQKMHVHTTQSSLDIPLSCSPSPSPGSGSRTNSFLSFPLSVSQSSLCTSLSFQASPYYGVLPPRPHTHTHPSRPADIFTTPYSLGNITHSACTDNCSPPPSHQHLWGSQGIQFPTALHDEVCIVKVLPLAVWTLTSSPHLPLSMWQTLSFDLSSKSC